VRGFTEERGGGVREGLTSLPGTSRSEAWAKRGRGTAKSKKHPLGCEKLLGARSCSARSGPGEGESTIRDALGPGGEWQV